MTDKIVLTSKKKMLTTVDNPFNPFTEFEAWYRFDVDKGYYTCGLLSRIVKTSNVLSRLDEEEAIDVAMDSIITNNFYGVHRVVDENFYRDEGDSDVSPA